MNLIFWMLARANETVTGSLQSSVTYAAPSGAGNNITFTFDKSYFVGYFANGDAWVSPSTAADGSGVGDGTVTINSITPAPSTRSFNFATTDVNTGTNRLTFTGQSIALAKVRFTTTNTLPAPLAIATDYWLTRVSSNVYYVAATKGGAEIDLTTQGVGTHTIVVQNGMHGWEVNPTTMNHQAFDVDSTASNWVIFDQERTPDLPLTITPGVSGTTSILKSASVAASAQRPQVQFTACLTVLAASLGNSTSKLRPPYFGTVKPIVSVANIVQSKFGTYSYNQWIATKGSALTTFAAIKAKFQHLRPHHYTVDGQWYFGSTDNYGSVSGAYGNNVAIDHQNAIGRLLADDFDYTNSDHKDALHYSLNCFLDMAAAGYGGTLWPANGGQHLGRKLPLVFGNYVLGGATSLFANSITAHEVTNATQFQEDGHTYIPAGGAPAGADALFGKISDGNRYTNYWGTVMSGTGAKDERDPYEVIDGEVDDALNVAGAGFTMGGSYQAQVQHCYIYNDRLANVYGLYSSWDSTLGSNAPFFLYARRYYASGAWASPDAYATYDGTDANYGVTFGGNPGVAGAGRKTSLHGVKGTSTYNSTDLDAFVTMLASYDPYKLYYTNVTGVNASTVSTASTGSRISANGTITAITGGEYQITSDRAGATVVVAWGSGTSQAVTAGQYVWLRLTTGSVGLTQYDVTITISGSSSTYSATTKSLFMMVDNNWASTTSAGHSKSSGITGLDTGANGKRFVIAIRFKKDAANNGNYLWGRDSNTQIKISTGTTVIFGITGGSNSGTFSTLPSSTFTEGILLLSFDTTQATKAAAYKMWFYDGTAWNQLTVDAGAYTQNATFVENTVFNTWTLGGANADTTLWDGGFEYMWATFGNGSFTLPDIDNSTVRAGFVQMNSDGSAPGVSPKLFFRSTIGAGATDGSTAESWNATGGISNQNATYGGVLTKSATNFANYSDV